MQWLLDVITLRFFITPYVILLIYWFGALVVPLAGWVLWRWLLGKLQQQEMAASGLEKLGDSVNRIDQNGTLRLLFWSGFVLVFLLLELLWRMLFEFLIAYFHIHQALMEISRSNG